MIGLFPPPPLLSWVLASWCKLLGRKGALKRDHPQLYEEMLRIQAEEGDMQGIPCPRPEVTRVHVQYLHQVMPLTNCFFICRQQGCTDKGSFVGLNTDWVSTAAAGGWKFVCPVCGNPYSMNLNKTGLIPANHIWHLETTGQLMLAEWPESLEEKSINEGAVLMAEHAAQQKFTELSREEVELKIGEVVANHVVPKPLFEKMQLSDKVIDAVTWLNNTRGNGELPYSWDHIKTGFTGGFYKYIEGESPVMKSDQVKDYLAMLYCLIEAFHPGVSSGKVDVEGILNAHPECCKLLFRGVATVWQDLPSRAKRRKT